jgi:RNA recognition motif-containing protein
MDSSGVVISDTKLFVGRLPMDARRDEVEDLFAPFGKIIKLGIVLYIYCSIY